MGGLGERTRANGGGLKGEFEATAAAVWSVHACRTRRTSWCHPRARVAIVGCGCNGEGWSGGPVTSPCAGTRGAGRARRRRSLHSLRAAAAVLVEAATASCRGSRDEGRAGCRADEERLRDPVRLGLVQFNGSGLSFYGGRVLGIVRLCSCRGGVAPAVRRVAVADILNDFECKDAEGTFKELVVKVTDVANIPIGTKVVVDFNEYKQAIGEEQGLLGGYLGTLAINGTLFPINYEKWNDMPPSRFSNYFQQNVKARFHFNIEEEFTVRYVIASLCKKWGDHRKRLWDGWYKHEISRVDLIQNVPDDIDADQWAGFCDYRLKPATVDLCKRNAENRVKQTVQHTGGYKPNSRRMEEMEQLETALTQSTSDESIVGSDDAVAKILGKEHSGRVRCLGIGAIPSTSFKRTRFHASTSTSVATPSSSSYAELQEKCKQLELTCVGLLNGLKSYFIAKDGRVPNELAGILPAQLTEVNDEHSSPSTPVDGRRSSHGSTCIPSHQEEV
ncbi:hypothetical protein Tsubulata_018348 [Turnera subulata]|uniref:Transposase Tnp1/En/Spm-like domain-containing protein n=1 Tax=Turnera subulata TaxID=218843 RepID=A0A9Q0FUX4_9ROSI|nr:hypothetical protein Tsubulata_018348 [Turnera subulata]